jgi:hypothetical protein
MAIQPWGGDRSCYRFRDRGPHSAQTEQSGATASLISPSRCTPNFISWRDQLVGHLYLFIRERQGEVSKKFKKFQKQLDQWLAGGTGIVQNVSGVKFACPLARPNRCFQFQKRSQLFIRPHNETLSVAVMRVRNPDSAR